MKEVFDLPDCPCGHVLHTHEGYCVNSGDWLCDTCFNWKPAQESPAPHVVDSLICKDCDQLAEEGTFDLGLKPGVINVGYAPDLDAVAIEFYAGSEEKQQILVGPFDALVLAQKLMTAVTRIATKLTQDR